MSLSVCLVSNCGFCKNNIFIIYHTNFCLVVFSIDQYYYFFVRFMSHVSGGEKEEDKTGDFHKNDGDYVSVCIDFISAMKK